MIHRPFNRFIVCPPNAKLSDSDSVLLQEGQIGLYDVLGETTENGMKAITDLIGKRKDENRYVLRVGKNKAVESRDSNDKAFSTDTFAIDEIIEVYASAPKKDGISVDEVLFGYNGIDAGTAIKAMKGDRIPIHLKMTGRPFELLGYPRGEVIVDDYIVFDQCPAMMSPCEECDPCEEVDVLASIMKTIERLKNQPIAGGAKVGDFVEIKPIHQCDPAVKERVETDVNFYCITMCDTGDGYALAQVQAAYPGMEVKRIERKLSQSTYHVMKEGGKPADYTQRLSSVIKGCANCPQGYTEKKGGFVYSVTIEDEGVDVSTIVSSLATGAEKENGQVNGVGMYTIVSETKLTKEAIKTFVNDNPTATVSFVAKIEDMCENPAISTIAWTACGSCKVSKDKYEITLPDNECGGSALEELKAAFPSLSIEDSGVSGGCQHKFSATVVTNMVCEECDDIFKDLYVSKAPEGFRQRNWKYVGAVAGDGTVIADPLPKNCKSGISFKGIDYMISPSDCLIDEISFEEGSVKLAVNGGYPDEQREAISTYFNPIHTEYKSTWAPRTHMGGNLLGLERESRMYFDGRSSQGNHMERVFTNEETRLDIRTQYADYALTYKPGRYSNAFGKRIDDHITIHFLVPYGAHEGIQEMFDMLAASAGIKTCAI